MLGVSTLYWRPSALDSQGSTLCSRVPAGSFHTPTQMPFAGLELKILAPLSYADEVLLATKFDSAFTGT